MRSIGAPRARRCSSSTTCTPWRARRPRRRWAGSWSTRRRGWRSSSGPASRRRSTCPGSGSPGSCWRSGRTTCASGHGRRSGCSGTSTGIRSRRPIWPRSRAGPRAGPRGCNCSISRRAASRPRTDGGSCPAAGSSGRLVREYLARNVLDELPASLRAFLVETSVLGRLTGPTCDALRGTRGSAAHPRRPRTPPDLHRRAGRRRRLVPLPRGAPRAPRPDPGRGAGRGGRARAACPGGRPARSGRRDGGGAGRVLPGRGLGRGPTAARRAGRAPGRRGDDVDRFAPAGGRAARPVAHARRGSRRARGGSMAGRARGVRTRRDGIRGVRRRARPATGALRTRGVARSRSHPARRLVGSDASGARPGAAGRGPRAGSPRRCAAGARPRAPGARGR